MPQLIPAYKMNFPSYLLRYGHSYKSTYAFNTLKEAKSYMKYEKLYNKRLSCFAVKKLFEDGHMYGVYERIKKEKK